ncbi:IS21 family transposase, partial [Pseudomonas syringae pv. actinidiae]|nr:IS21 family transposase [Pseudomonas syringae pv. actinidiae]
SCWQKCSSITPGKQRRHHRQTGEIRQAQIFVAVLGASSYTFAEATWSQKLPTGWARTSDALFFFGGTTQILVPDNLRSGVTKAHRYEPDINPSYRDLREHYGIAVLPARSRKPKDKAKVEVGVQVVERWILAVLRNRQFFSLGELNTAIALLLDRLNHKPFKKLPGSRRSAFEPSTNRRCKRYRSIRTSTPNGKKYASISTTTSRSTATFTRCHTSW